MAKFADNNDQNASIGYMFFKLNCNYHPRVSFKEDTSTCSWLKTVDKLSTEL